MNSTRQTGRPGAAKTDSSAPSQAAAAQASAPLPHVERVKTALVQIDSVEQFSGGFAVRRKNTSWVRLLFLLYPLIFFISDMAHSGAHSLLWILPVFGFMLSFLLLQFITAFFSERSLRPHQDKLRSLDFVDAAVNAAFGESGLWNATPPIAQAALNSNLRTGDARRLWIALSSWPWLLRPRGRNLALDAIISQLCGWLMLLLITGIYATGWWFRQPGQTPLPQDWQAWPVGAAAVLLLVAQALPQRRDAGRKLV